jgi:hypothetical protein
VGARVRAARVLAAVCSVAGLTVASGTVAAAESTSTPRPPAASVVGASTTRHISGTVRNAVGAPLAGITVTNGGTPAVTGQTTATGAYDLSVPVGTYIIGFSDPSGDYAAGHYCGNGPGGFEAYPGSNCYSGTPVDATNADVSAIDVVMPIAYRVSGRVTHSGAPLVGAHVRIERDLRTAMPSTVADSVTVADGSYSIPVAVGVYQIRFEVGEAYAQGVWDGRGFSPSLRDAADVRVVSAVGHIDVEVPLHIGSPTNVTAVARDGGARVTWQAPSEDGAAPITGYSAVAFQEEMGDIAFGACTAIAPALGCDVAGLSNGTEYYFSVSASNSAHDFSRAPTDSNAVTPTVEAGQPRNVGTEPGDGTATISWSNPTYGPGDLTGYWVDDATDTYHCHAGPTETSCQVSGLTDRVEYEFKVTASFEGYGDGPASDPVYVTPATVPDAPTDVWIEPFDGFAVVSWSAPANDGGNPIQSYAVSDPTHTYTCTTERDPYDVNGDTPARSCPISGLSVGQIYTFSVVATNQVGAGVPSNSAAVTPDITPESPQNVTLVPGDGSVTVSWTAPPPNGGSPIVEYRVSAAPGDLGCKWLSGPLSCTVTDLPNGQQFRFAVQPKNRLWGYSSPFTGWVAPATTPGVPTSVHATPGDASARVSWTAPSSNGGSSIAGYTVTSSPGGKTCAWMSDALSCTVSGLTNGTSYIFTVQATSSVGMGLPSAASNSVTPAAVPGAPTAVHATAGDGSATVSWTAPASNGSAITGYAVTSSPGGKTCTTTGALSCSVSGLTNGRAYTFTVTATNGVGTGPASAASNSVTPQAPGPVTSTYHPIDPVRLLDTRADNGHSGKLQAGVPMTFRITGRSDASPLIPAGATAVTGNLTVTGSSAPWAVFIGPTPIERPTSSTVNFVAGQTVANGLTVALSASGTLSATYLGPAGATTELVFDVTGYYTPDETGATFTPVEPVRLLDTRYGNGHSGKITTNVPMTFQITGRSDRGPVVPSNATAVTGNLTVANSNASWAVYVGPNALAHPTTSSLNFAKGQILSNNVTVSLGAGGTLSATFLGPAGATTDLVFDVTGYFTADASGYRFVPLEPARLVDSRVDSGLAGKTTASTPRTFPVATRGGVPDNSAAVTGNLTITDETAGWAAYLGPSPIAYPTTSTINFLVKDIKGNGLTVALSGAGTLSATYMGPAGATTSLVFDVTGYFVK